MSGAASRRKGNRAEVEVVRVLRSAGFEAETSRNARNGTQRGEDIVSDFPMSIEVKNHTRTDLAGWWTQAVEQSGGAMPVVIHKRVGKSNADEWWATMDFQTLIRLIRECRQDV